MERRVSSDEMHTYDEWQEILKDRRRKAEFERMREELRKQRR